MLEFLVILMPIFGPIAGAIVLGFVQLGLYKAAAKVGMVKEETIPMFPILLFRGLLIILGIIALAAVGSMILKGDGDDPLAGFVLPIELLNYVR